MGKTRGCEQYQNGKGHCKMGENCLYAHGEEELKLNDHSTEGVKARLCEHFMNGHCFYGNECHFAHGEAELRVDECPEAPPATDKASADKSPKKSKTNSSNNNDTPSSANNA